MSAQKVKTEISSWPMGIAWGHFFFFLQISHITAVRNSAACIEQTHIAHKFASVVLRANCNANAIAKNNSCMKPLICVEDNYNKQARQIHINV